MLRPYKALRMYNSFSDAADGHWKKVERTGLKTRRYKEPGSSPASTGAGGAEAGAGEVVAAEREASPLKG